MNDYKDAYQNYYRNINKNTAEKNSNEKKSFFNFNGNEKMKFRNSKLDFSNKNFKKYIIKKITRDIIGASCILITFIVLKYTPDYETNKLYNNLKKIVCTSVNYDQSIDVLKDIDVANIKGKNVEIWGFTFDDFKSGSIKEKASKLIDYIRNNSLKADEKEV